MSLARILSLVLPFGVVALAFAPTGEAEVTPPACAWEIEYNLAANLKLTDTPMGEGNGVYPIGPGKVVLRYDDVAGQPGGAVKMLGYRMREHFTIKSKTLVWSTTVVTDSKTRATPGACAVEAEGTREGRMIRWATPVHGYRTDGTVTCKGSLCGKFGAPPPGTMQLHIGPNPVQFSPFVFGPESKTFTMATTHVSKTSMPKQSAEIALSGREIRRACVPIVQCAK